MFCPKCKYEYRDDIKVCPDCDELLVESLAKEIQEFNPDEKICVLTTVADEFEAEIIIAKLRAEGIYACKRFRASDGYNRIVLGKTVLGVEILVAQSDLDTATEVITIEEEW